MALFSPYLFAMKLYEHPEGLGCQMHWEDIFGESSSVKNYHVVVMDTTQKIEEGLEQVSNEKFYKPLEEPIVSQTAAKVKTIVNTLSANGHIDKMTYQWFNSGQNALRIPEFYTLTKIHKPTPVGRPIVSGSGGPTERISSFVDSLLQPIAKKQESYI